MGTVIAVASAHGNHDDEEYVAYMSNVQRRFLENTGGGKGPLFTTDAGDLWTAYIESFFDPVERQHHNCNACRHFITRFGGLVVIDENGLAKSAIWNTEDAPEVYKPAVAAMEILVRKARVTGVFLSSERVLGTPVTGIWRHFAVELDKSAVHKGRALTAGQAMAEKREDFKNVSFALSQITLEQLEQAVALLKSDALYRSEKVLGQAEWLRELKSVCLFLKNRLDARRANMVWLAVATATAGFCHPRSSMIGTLLEDIAAGMDFAEVSRRFAAKMHPLQYQRPQVAPKAGAIEAAEKLVDTLGIARSLERRRATIADLRPLWVGAAPATPSGVFGHLKDRRPPVRDIPPAKVMTWAKFEAMVLRTADRIECLAPPRGPYAGLLTATHADAPPILQWDTEEDRNPVSWYFYSNQSTAAEFALSSLCLHPVSMVTLKPSMWTHSSAHHGRGVMFVIDGCHDTREPPLCLFPEIMKSELHGVRSVIEAHSASSKPSGPAEGSAAGLLLHEGGTWDITLRVWSGGIPMDYKLDRWD